MKKYVFAMLFIFLLFLLTSTGSANDEKLIWDDSWPKVVRIVTGKIGGGNYMAGSAMRNALAEEFPNVNFINEASHSSVANLKLIEIGDAHIGGCTNDVAYEAWRGTEGLAVEGVKYKEFRLFAPRAVDQDTFVVLAKSPITDIKQFTGKVSSGTVGGANDVFCRELFETLNINAEVVNLSPDDSIDALKNGMIQGYLFGHPAPAVQELALTTAIRILGLDENDGRKFLEAYPKYLYPVEIPAGYYKDVDESVIAAGMQLV